MKFCLLQILDVMAEFQEEKMSSRRDEFATSEELVEHLESHFKVPVSNEGLLEDTFKAFVNEYCG